MNFLKQVIATILMCLALQYFLPWWSLVIGAAAVGYWAGNKGFVSFGAGFFGVALLWLATAMIIDAQTSSILTEKVARLFPTQSTPLLLLLTALVGGLCGGFAGLTGALIRK